LLARGLEAKGADITKRGSGLQTLIDSIPAGSGLSVRCETGGVNSVQVQGFFVRNSLWKTLSSNFGDRFPALCFVYV